jgi:hypothetical protein
MNTTWQERLWAKAVPNEAGCWIWQAGVDRYGYGRFKGPRSEGRCGVTTAHRWAYVATHGSVDPNLEVDHLCHTPLCVNPAHLEAVTHAENMRRRRPITSGDCCKWGHEFTEANTKVNSRGWRSCRACAANSKRGLPRWSGSPLYEAA